MKTTVDIPDSVLKEVMGFTKARPSGKQSSLR
jgi:hypothetical protein